MIVNPWDSCNILAKPDLAMLERQKRISKTEKKFLNVLETKLGVEILRQVVFPGFIMIDGCLDSEDFKICIEFDGPANHKDKKKVEKDNRRDGKLMERGYSIYRCQWFELVPFSEIDGEVERRAEEAVKPIQLMMRLQNLKNQNKTQ